MYIEELIPNQRVMDPQVNKATVALKGLLGIGRGTTLPTATHRQEAATQPAEPQNFAWLAFQSSPDASKLPIPAGKCAIWGCGIIITHPPPTNFVLHQHRKDGSREVGKRIMTGTPDVAL
jgi:hypothetical protein